MPTTAMGSPAPNQRFCEVGQCVGPAQFGGAFHPHLSQIFPQPAETILPGFDRPGRFRQLWLHAPCSKPAVEFCTLCHLLRLLDEIVQRAPLGQRRILLLLPECNSDATPLPHGARPPHSKWRDMKVGAIRLAGPKSTTFTAASTLVAKASTAPG